MIFQREEVQLSREDTIRLGRAARDLLESELWKLVSDQTELSLVDEWLASATVEKREHAWAKLHALNEVTRTLTSIVNDGEHAAEVLRRATT